VRLGRAKRVVLCEQSIERNILLSAATTTSSEFDQQTKVSTFSCSRNYFSPRNFLPSDYIKATKKGNTQLYDVRLDNRGNTGNSILGISGFLEFNKRKSSHKFNFGQFSISMKETLKVTFLGYLSALRKESVPSLGTRPIYILVSDNPDMVFLAVEGNNVAKRRCVKKVVDP
jgi:hypothetical protein